MQLQVKYNLRNIILGAWGQFLLSPSPALINTSYYLSPLSESCSPQVHSPDWPPSNGVALCSCFLTAALSDPCCSSRSFCLRLPSCICQCDLSFCPKGLYGFEPLLFCDSGSHLSFFLFFIFYFKVTEFCSDCHHLWRGRKRPSTKVTEWNFYSLLPPYLWSAPRGKNTPGKLLIFLTEQYGQATQTVPLSKGSPGNISPCSSEPAELNLPACTDRTQLSVKAVLRHSSPLCKLSMLRPSAWHKNVIMTKCLPD